MAITPTAEEKEAVAKVTAQLKQAASHGRFTPAENLHITLAFLGETPHPKAVCRAMDAMAASPFSLQLTGLGQFAGRGICFMGISPSSPLLAVQRRLAIQLSQEGFILEKRPFQPHLTLGRQVEFPADLDFTSFGRTIAPIPIAVEKLSLMRSERADGKLVYTEIYSVPLTGGSTDDGL